jgi:putative Holliday junction resolvase
MALDVGHKRIGVAITDPLKVLARPLGCLVRRSLEHDLQSLLELIAEHQVSCLVLGLPQHLDGRVSPMTETIREFGRHLRQSTGVDIKWCDERLSSKEAEERMAQMKVPIRDRRGLRDAYSAAIILERFIQEGPAPQ